MIGPIWIGVQIRGRDGRGRIDKSTLFDPLLCLFEVDLLDGRSEGWTGTEIAAFFRGFEKVICPLGHGRYGQGGGGKAVRIGPLRVTIANLKTEVARRAKMYTQFGL